LILKGHLLGAKEWSIPTNSKSCRNATMAAWMNKELLAKLQLKKGVYRRWKQGRITWEVCGGTMRVCRDDVGRAKTTWNLIWWRMLKKEGLFLTR